mgnify:CR=1 FL=1
MTKHYVLPMKGTKHDGLTDFAVYFTDDKAWHMWEYKDAAAAVADDGDCNGQTVFKAGRLVNAPAWVRAVKPVEVRHD